MATIAHRTSTAAEPAALRTGAALMALAALGFIGYAVIFFVRNFTGAFLELGIGPEQVDVGPDEIRAFSDDLYHYIAHLHIAVSGFIAATGLATAALAWFGVRRGLLWAYLTAGHLSWDSPSHCLRTTRGAWPPSVTSDSSTSPRRSSSSAPRLHSSRCWLYARAKAREHDHTHRHRR
jgi:hypothetical protein